MDFSGQYLTFEEYKSLGGTLPDQMPFNLLEFEARQNIDKYTFGRLKDLQTQNQEVKLCDFRLIESLKTYQEYDKKTGIASESTDGYSVSYTSKSTEDVKAREKDMENLIKDYLLDCKLENGTPYLYRGN